MSGICRAIARTRSTTSASTRQRCSPVRFLDRTRRASMILARPADDEIETVVLRAHDDLFDQHANDPFARGYCVAAPFRMPGAFDVGAEPENSALSLAWSYAIQRRNAERCELVLKASLASFRRSFQRQLLSSPATRRLSRITTASYCRRACTASKRACSSA